MTKFDLLSPVEWLNGCRNQQVYENNDLGLLNFQLHPDWPATPYGYMLYTHDPG